MICYSYNKAIYHHHHYHHHRHHLYHHRHHYHHFFIIIIIIIIIIRYKSLTNNRKNRKKLQKNNVQNTVTKEHRRVYKENEVSSVSNSTKTDENKKDQNRNNEVKSVVLIGNSMVKHLNVWDVSKKVHKSECKICVKLFPGAKTSCKDYVKQSLRSTTNHFILHVGTNDLNSNETSEAIAKEIVDLATSLKNNQRDVSVSNIILRTDNSKLNVKRCEVNQILSKLCHEKNIYLIDHSKKIKPNHLNKSKLYLNKNGSNILSRTFVNEISRVFNWRVADNNSNINIERCNTIVLHDISKVGDCKVFAQR